MQKIFFIFLIFWVIYPQNTHAAQLNDLADDFLKRLKSVYGEPEKPFDPIDQIPDGGTLLLSPRVDRLMLGDEIFAIKHNNAIYIELYDFISILNLAIDYDPDTLVGSGWYLREDWEMSFDLNEGIVESKGVTYNTVEGDLYEEDGLTYVKSDVLGNWFDMALSYDIQQQILNIESQHPFPAVSKFARNNDLRKRNTREFRTATLPRLEQPKSNFDINTVDISLGHRMERRENQDFESRQTGSLYAQGEFLKHNGYLFMSGNDRDSLSNVRGELFKKSENPDLLGPLNARQYSIGDIRETRIPLINESQQNFGVRLTNSSLDNTDFATTDIEGTAFPSWDVQLYRNGILIDVQTVGSDGRYDFEEIQLFAGDNDFELFFLGPQGEIRLKTVSAPVSSALLQSQDGTYEMSFTLEDTQTYRNNFQDDEDTYTPSFSGRYNKLIGNNHLGYLGFRSVQILGERKFFASVGATSTLGQTLLDTNFAIDEQGAASAEALVRRKLMGWDTSFNTRFISDDFSVNDVPNNIVFSMSANAQRALDINGYKTNFLLGALYQQDVDGDTSEIYNAAVANTLWRTNISNTLRYEKEANSLIDDAQISHTLGLRRGWGDFFLNLASTYDIAPESELSTVQAQLNYRYSNDLTADLTYNRQFLNDEDIYRFNMNYMHDKFRLSPYIEYSSDNEVIGGFNLNFSFYDAPNSQYPQFTGNRLSGRGGVSAFVYHDKDGNKIFDNNDEPLPETFIRSVTSPRQLMTDQDGYVTIPNLPTSRATDIIVKSDDLPDPFMIPATEGASILPTEGTIHHLEFPVHLTGEIDGMAYYMDDDVIIDNQEAQKQAVSFQTIILKSLDTPDREPVEIKTERDGYYVMFMIPPGRYLTLPASTRRYGNTLPKMIEIGYDGTIIPNVDHQLVKNGHYVPYDVSFNSDVAGVSRYIKVKDSGISSLSKTLNAYFKDEQNQDDLYDGLKPIKNVTNDTGEYTYYTLAFNADDTDALLHQKCQRMLSVGQSCHIVVQANN